MKKLTLLGVVIALIVGLSVALPQTVLLAQQDTPAGTATVQKPHKSKHKMKSLFKKQVPKEKKEKVGEKVEPKGDK